jgi:hypothetical protein
MRICCSDIISRRKERQIQGGGAWDLPSTIHCMQTFVGTDMALRIVCQVAHLNACPAVHTHWGIFRHRLRTSPCICKEDLRSFGGGAASWEKVCVTSERSSIKDGPGRGWVGGCQERHALRHPQALAFPPSANPSFANHTQKSNVLALSCRQPKLLYACKFRVATTCELSRSLLSFT